MSVRAGRASRTCIAIHLQFVGKIRPPARRIWRTGSPGEPASASSSLLPSTVLASRRTLGAEVRPRPERSPREDRYSRRMAPAPVPRTLWVGYLSILRIRTAVCRAGNSPSGLGFSLFRNFSGQRARSQPGSLAHVLDELQRGPAVKPGMDESDWERYHDAAQGQQPAKRRGLRPCSESSFDVESRFSPFALSDFFLSAIDAETRLPPVAAESRWAAFHPSQTGLT